LKHRSSRRRQLPPRMLPLPTEIKGGSDERTQ